MATMIGRIPVQTQLDFNPTYQYSSGILLPHETCAAEFIQVGGEH